MNVRGSACVTALAAALALLTGCGGQGAARPSAASTSAAPTSASRSPEPTPSLDDAAQRPWMAHEIPAADLDVAPVPAERVAGVLANAEDVAPELIGLTWRADPTGVVTTEVSGKRVERLWWTLRELVPVTGRWPVMIGADPDGCCGDTPQVALAAAAKLDLRTWYAERAEEQELETTPIDLRAVAAGRQYEGDYAFWTPKDSVTGEFQPRVTLALIPSPRSWEAAAWVGFGGWNDCPESFEHVAIAHAWHDRWGAEVFALSTDQVEMYVWRPPHSPREAAGLAQEQYAYSPDDIWQGDPEVDTREKFASALRDFNSWQFWWD